MFFSLQPGTIHVCLVTLVVAGVPIPQQQRHYLLQNVFSDHYQYKEDSIHLVRLSPLLHGPPPKLTISEMELLDIFGRFVLVQYYFYSANLEYGTESQCW